MMSDDLVKRLRSGRTPLKDGKMMTWKAQCAEAAERIEELEAENTVLAARALEAEAELAKAVKIAQKAIEQLRSYGKK